MFIKVTLFEAGFGGGDFEENFRDVQHSSLGVIAAELKTIDYADHIPDLSEEEYAFIDRIRVLRNYWCHQCYVDYMYITNDSLREEKFQEIARQLSEDERQTYALFQKLERFRTEEIERYRSP